MKSIHFTSNLKNIFQNFFFSQILSSEFYICQKKVLSRIRSPNRGAVRGGGSKGTSRDAPSLVQIPSFSSSFWQNFRQKLGWRTPSGKSWIHHYFMPAYLIGPFMQNTKFHYISWIAYQSDLAAPVIVAALSIMSKTSL